MWGESVQPTSDGGYFIAGNAGIQNGNWICLVKTDSNGDILWTKEIGNGGPWPDGYASSGQQTTDQGYIIAGATGEGLYLVKLEPDVGTEETKTTITDRCISTTIFSGPLQLPAGKKCRVFDITGRVVEPSKIRRGIYFIEIDGQITQKVVKIR